MKPLGNQLASLPVRIIFGFSFMFYGLPKLFDPQTHGFIAGMLTQIGVPAPDLMTYVVGSVESLGGLALLLGALVPLASAALIPVMLVALFTVHLPQGFSFMHIVGLGESGPQFGMPGYEVNLIYIAGLLTLMMVGAGPLSVDGVRASRAADSVSAQR